VDSAKLNIVDRTHPALVKSSVAKKEVFVFLFLRHNCFNLLLIETQEDKA